MSINVYQNFRYLQFYSLFSLFFCSLKYDNEKSNYYQSKQKIMKILFISLVGLMYAADTSYYFMKDVRNLTKIELINLFGMPVSIGFVIHNLYYSLKKEILIISVMDNLQIIEETLTKHMNYSQRSRWVNYVAKIVTIPYILEGLLVIPITYYQITRTYLKVYATNLAFAYYVSGYISYFIINVLLLSDRTYILNEILNRYSNIHVSKDMCYRCTNPNRRSNLCKKHQLQFMLAVTNLIFKTSNLLKELNEIMLAAPVFVVLTYSTTYTLTIINHIFSNELYSDKLLMVYWLCFCVTFYGFAVAISIENLNGNVDILKHMCHRMYCKSVNKPEIRDDIYALSMYMTQGYPSFIVGYIFPVKLRYILPIISGAVVFAIFIMHTDI